MIRVDRTHHLTYTARHAHCALGPKLVLHCSSRDRIIQYPDANEVGQVLRRRVGRQANQAVKRVVSRKTRVLCEACSTPHAASLKTALSAAMRALNLVGKRAYFARLQTAALPDRLAAPRAEATPARALPSPPLNARHFALGTKKRLHHSIKSDTSALLAYLISCQVQSKTS